PARPFLEEVGAEPGRLRIGVIGTAPDPFPTDPVTTAAVDRTATLLTELGHEVRPIELGIDITESMAIGGRIMMAQLVATVDARLGALARARGEGDLEPWTRTMLDNGRTVTGTDLNLALQGAQRIGWQLAEMFGEDGVDVVLLPTLPLPVPELGHLDATDPASMWTRSSAYSSCVSLFNVSGQPAISLPAGSDTAGLPVGGQFAADYRREDLRLRLSAQAEHAAPWPAVAPGFAGGCPGRHDATTHFQEDRPDDVSQRPGHAGSAARPRHRVRFREPRRQDTHDRHRRADVRGTGTGRGLHAGRGERRGPAQQLGGPVPLRQPRRTDRGGAPSPHGGDPRRSARPPARGRRERTRCRRPHPGERPAGAV